MNDGHFLLPSISSALSFSHPQQIAKGRKKPGEKNTVAEREPEGTPMPFQ